MRETWHETPRQWLEEQPVWNKAAALHSAAEQLSRRDPFVSMPALGEALQSGTAEILSMIENAFAQEGRRGALRFLMYAQVLCSMIISKLDVARLQSRQEGAALDALIALTDEIRHALNDWIGSINS